MTEKKKAGRLIEGLVIGFLFGFLLQKGGVSKYDILISQLLLTDFTVVKIILAAIITTMLGVSFLYPRGLIEAEGKSGSIKNAVIGGLIFGAGFGILGYCPGTIASAIGNGYIDAAAGGLPGILIGTVIFAKLYSNLQHRGILTRDRFHEYSLFHTLKNKAFLFTVPFSILLMIILHVIESNGL